MWWSWFVCQIQFCLVLVIVLRNKCLHLEFFWPVFSCIRTEFGDLLNITQLYSRFTILLDKFKFFVFFEQFFIEISFPWNLTMIDPFQPRFALRMEICFALQSFVLLCFSVNFWTLSNKYFNSFAVLEQVFNSSTWLLWRTIISLVCCCVLYRSFSVVSSNEIIMLRTI